MPPAVSQGPGLKQADLVQDQRHTSHEYRAMLERELQATRQLRRQLEAAGPARPAVSTNVPPVRAGLGETKGALSSCDLERRELRSAVDAQTHRLHTLRGELSDMMKRANHTLHNAVAPPRSSNLAGATPADRASLPDVPESHQYPAQAQRSPHELDSFSLRLQSERACERQWVVETQRQLQEEMSQVAERSEQLAQQMQALDAAQKAIDSSPRKRYLQ